MNSNTFKQIVNLLIPHMQDVRERRALVRLALHGCPVLEQGQIDWEGTPRNFTVSLVEALDRYGAWNGELTVITIVNECREMIGSDRQVEIDNMLRELRPQNVASPPKSSRLSVEELTRRTLEVIPPPFAWCEVPTDARLIIPDFRIAKYPITTKQFDVFVNADDGYRNPSVWGVSGSKWRINNGVEKSSFEGDDYPRTNVCWFEAVAFSHWLSMRVGLDIRLPTEAEWQRAAQGNNKFKYPWGENFDSKRCNTLESGVRRTTPVTAYEFSPTDERSGLSPFGVSDMAGNVAEWCLDNWDNDLSYAIQRGGSWQRRAQLAYTTSRVAMLPDMRLNDFGFRVVHSISE